MKTKHHAFMQLFFISHNYLNITIVDGLIQIGTYAFSKFISKTSELYCPIVTKGDIPKIPKILYDLEQIQRHSM